MGYVSNMDPAAKYTDTSSTSTSVDDVFTYASATTPGMVFQAPDGRFGAMNNPEDDAQSAVNNPLVRLNQVAGKHCKTQFENSFCSYIKTIQRIQHHRFLFI